MTWKARDDERKAIKARHDMMKGLEAPHTPEIIPGLRIPKTTIPRTPTSSSSDVEL